MDYEERYRLLVEMSPEPIAVHSEGLIVYVNPACAKLAGARSPADLINRPLLDFVHPDSRQAVVERIHKTQVDRQPTELLAEKFLRLDGQIVEVEVVAIPFTFNDKPATQVIMRDITERRRIAEHLQQAQKMETIGTLAGGIAHDFNNLLAGMIGTLSMLDYQLGGPTPIPKEDLNEQLGVVRDCALRAAEIVQQLLSLSRRTELRLQTVDLTTLASDVAKICKVSFDPGIHIELEPPAELSLVEADPVRIKQVFLNLALNARDAMPKGGVLRFEFTRPEPGIIRASVRDTGEGIKPEHLPRIFDPFFTTKAVGKGTGLGLAIVYGIITQHRGRVSVESSPKQGSVFHIDLPASTKRHAPNTLPLSEIPRGTETILVVDDEQTVRHLARAMLQSLGYKVICAADGEEALTLLLNPPEPIDLVILDLIMPRLSGRETLARLRKINASIPVVVSSGIQVDAHAHGLRGLKISTLLTKPYEMTDLGLAIRIALTSRPHSGVHP